MFFDAVDRRNHHQDEDQQDGAADHRRRDHQRSGLLGFVGQAFGVMPPDDVADVLAAEKLLVEVRVLDRGLGEIIQVPLQELEVLRRGKAVIGGLGLGQADQRVVGSGRIGALRGLDRRLQVLAVLVFDVQPCIGALERVRAVGGTVGLVHVGGPGEGLLEALVAAAGRQQAAGKQREAGGERQQKKEGHHHRDDLADLEAGIENAVDTHGMDPFSE